MAVGGRVGALGLGALRRAPRELGVQLAQQVVGGRGEARGVGALRVGAVRPRPAEQGRHRRLQRGQR